MPEFHLVFADWRARPGRGPNWREERRVNFPTEDLFRREYPETLEDVLLAGEDIVFPSWAIEQCLDDYDFPVTAIKGNPKHRYLKMWDQGRKRDACVGITLDLSVAPYQVCDYKRLMRRPYPFIQETIEKVHDTWPGETYVGDDNTSLAIVENLKVGASHFLVGSLKPRCIMALKVALEQGHLRIHRGLTQLIFELQSYMWDDEGLVQDSVMALANAMYVAGPPLQHIEAPSLATTKGRSQGLLQGQERPQSRIAPLLVGSSSRRSQRSQGANQADYIN